MKILMVDELHESIHDLMRKESLDYDYKPEIDRRGIINIIDQYEGLIIRSKTQVDKEIIDRAKRLKFVARAGAGVDNIDQEYLKTKNILCLNAAEGNANALAEHTLGLIFALLNKIVSSNIELRKGIWKREYNRGHELSEKTIGIIGYGAMGKAVVGRLECLGCKILIYDKFKTNYAPNFALEASLEELKEKSDIVSFHFPLNEENRSLVDINYLSEFKKKIWLINAARGGVLVAKDLLTLLDDGKIKGAALDVWENEKLETMDGEEKSRFESLCLRENVIVTPHVGGWSFESYEKINQVLVNKIAEKYG